MAKKIRRGSVLTSEHFSEVKDLLKNYAQAEVSRLTKWGTSTVSLIDRSDDYTHYRALRLEANTRAGVVGPMRLKNYPLKKLSEQGTQLLKESATQSTKNELEVAIEKLGATFESLKEQIVVVATLSAEAKSETTIAELRDQVKDKDIEIIAMKTVVDAAQSSNLITNLKNKLMSNSIKA